MGKLMIECKASKEYAYDLMEISVKFWATEGSAAAALKRVTEQSEEFLVILDKAGISPETVHIGKDSTRKIDYNSSRFEIEVKRELTLRVAFNMDVVNFIRDTIQKNALDAEIETTYKFLNLDAIHKELIQLALEDSRQKATYVAEAMGQKVTGIKTMTVGNTRGKNLLPRPSKSSGENCYYDELLNILSRRVQAPLSMESDSVEVVWLIE